VEEKWRKSGRKVKEKWKKCGEGHRNEEESEGEVAEKSGKVEKSRKKV